ncbi:MAG: DEAD/DEAH box helicase [Cyanobacteria bacterium J06634_5]
MVPDHTSSSQDLYHKSGQKKQLNPCSDNIYTHSDEVSPYTKTSSDKQYKSSYLALKPHINEENPQPGLDSIARFLEVINRDRIWIKWGHGRFAEVQRVAQTYQIKPTKLAISQEDVNAGRATEEERSRSRIQTGESYDLEWLLRHSRLNEEDGIFWIPAATDAALPLKSDITHTDTISCEIDLCPKAEQLERFEWFAQVTGLKYGLLLTSGSKSIHGHIFLNEPVPFADADRLRKLFILCLLGDPAIANRHQPMRAPGFYRKSKGQYQALLSSSTQRYSLDEIEAGLKLAYTDLNWAFPKTLSEDLWRDCLPLLKERKDDNQNVLPVIVTEQRTELGKLLARGDRYYIDQAKKRAAKAEANRLRRAQLELSGEFDLLDAIKRIDEQLSPDQAFNGTDHKWKFSGNDKARGYCHWHGSTSNSAWISRTDRGWAYHCPTCSADKPLSGFAYWLAERFGPAAPFPQGKQWANLATEYAQLHGIKVPEWQPLQTTAATEDNEKLPSASSSSETDKKPKTRTAQLSEKRAQRNREAYLTIAKMLGIPAPAVEHLDKTDARKLFYQPLIDHLGAELPGNPQIGFAASIPINWSDRTLFAYNCSKGTGKSNAALMNAIKETLKLGKRTLIFVPTRGLASEYAERINGALNRKIATTHLQKERNTASVVVSCPESAYKFKDASFELVCCDEANEVFERIEGGQLGQAPRQSLETFNILLKKAEQVVLATAEMWGKTLSAAQRMGKFDQAHTKIQQRIRPATEMSVIEYGSFYQWLNEIIVSVQRGARVSIPTGAQGKGRLIDRVLRATFPDKNGIVIDGRATFHTIRQQYLAEPDEFLDRHKPDWFIFSPIINSGVSMEKPHFTAQFEYITPAEGYESASQRGERVRSAIGRDGAISCRHVYFSEHGAPTIESYPEALNPIYWEEKLTTEEEAPIGAAAALAKALGAEKTLNPIQAEQKTRAEQRPELPCFLAIKAFNIFYKREKLRAEWLSYGWGISVAEKPDTDTLENIGELKNLAENVQIGLIRQDGRTLQKARVRPEDSDIDEAVNPFQRMRARKAHYVDIVGADFLKRQSEEFFIAWLSDQNANNPGINAVVRSCLLDMAIKQPDDFKQIERAKAIKFLAGKPRTQDGEFWELPSLPAPARDIELVSIISRCPAINAVLTGQLETWSNYTKDIIEAHQYLVEQAGAIAANTKRVGLQHGYKFSKKMKPAEAFQKALKIVGFETYKKRAGEGKRWNIHRLATSADTQTWFEAQKKIWAEASPSPLVLFTAQMKLIRAETRTAINTAIGQRQISKMKEWGKQVEQVAAAVEGLKKRHTNLIQGLITKGCDVSVAQLMGSTKNVQKSVYFASTVDGDSFEQALLSASTMLDMEKAKAAYPESIRREVMADWMADGRYSWLLTRVAELKSVAA